MIRHKCFCQLIFSFSGSIINTISFLCKCYVLKAVHHFPLERVCIYDYDSLVFAVNFFY